MAGDIDHEILPALREAIAEVVGQARPTIVLDFSEVTYIDSTGVSVLFDLAERVGDHRVIDVIGLSRPIRGILDISGFSQLQHVRFAPAEEPVAPAGKGRETEKNEKRPKSWTRIFAPQLPELEHVRTFVQAIADDTRLESERAFALKVSVSEAAANAIEHGGPVGDVTIQAKRTRERLAITVSHLGAFTTRASDDPTRSHRGMGLPLMLALVDEVTVSRPATGGTAVTLSLFLR